MPQYRSNYPQRADLKTAHIVMPRSLYASIKRSAQREMRTISSEVCVRLLKSLQRSPSQVPEQPQAENDGKEIDSHVEAQTNR
jgi:hypothetical protein